MHAIVTKIRGEAVALIFHSGVVVDVYVTMLRGIGLDPSVDRIDLWRWEEARLPWVVEGG